MSNAANPEITIWLCPPVGWSERSAEAVCLPWLDQTERARWQSFVFARDRHLYLVAHGLLRWALTSAAPDVSPQDWQFRADARGRPSLSGPGDTGTLSFSLSHTRNMTAVAIGAGAALGVDVEARRDVSDPALAAAAAAFAPSERAWLASLPHARRGDATLRLWTLKEAYAKACGLGLHLPLDGFAFMLDEHRGVRSFQPPGDEPAAGEWEFLEAAPGECRLALAWRRANAQPAPERSLRIGMTVRGMWSPRCTLLMPAAGVTKVTRPSRPPL